VPPALDLLGELRLDAVQRIAGFARPPEVGQSGGGEQMRCRRNIALMTLRSSAGGTPRGLVGSSGTITDHSKSVTSQRQKVMGLSPL
jgi:hypothetical protein